jgi:hypothetical protein
MADFEHQFFPRNLDGILAVAQGHGQLKSIEKRCRKPFLVARNPGLGAAAFHLRMAQKSAGAGIGRAQNHGT